MLRDALHRKPTMTGPKNLNTDAVNIAAPLTRPRHPRGDALLMSTSAGVSAPSAQHPRRQCMTHAVHITQMAGAPTATNDSVGYNSINAMVVAIDARMVLFSPKCFDIAG